MTDNVLYTQGTGTTIATDDVGSVHFQKVKMDVGKDGVSLQPDGSIPVYIVSGTGAYLMNDPFVDAVAIAGQLDDTGTTAATENNIAPLRITSQRGAHVNIRRTDGIELGVATTPLITTGYISSGTMDLTGNALTSLQLSDDIVHTTNAAINKAALVAGQFDDVGTTAATEDNVAAIRITSQRGAHVNLRRNDGIELGTAITPLIVTGYISSGTVDLTGNALTSLQLTDDIVHSTNAAINKAALMAGQFDDSGTTTATEDNVAPIRITAQRAAHFNLRDTTGDEILPLTLPKVVSGEAQLWSYHENSSSSLTDVVVQTAPGTGFSLYVTDIVASTGAATALNIFFEEGATTVLGPYYLEAVSGRGLAIQFRTPKKITENTALTVTTSAAIAHGIDVIGYVGRA